MSSRICLIDCDPIKYAASCVAEKKDKETEIITVAPMEHVFYNINSMIKKCIKACGARQYVCFLTPIRESKNFRSLIYSEYKAHRKDVRKPYHLDNAHKHVLDRWRAILAVGEEADDTMSIYHCGLNPFGFDTTFDSANTVLCSIDKDFNNVPGWHYNPRKDELYFVSEIEALRNFYFQIVAGDKADNVPRVKKGWREKETYEKLQKAETELELYDIILECVYTVMEKDLKDTDVLMHEGLAKDFILRNGQLVWLRRNAGELWALPS